MRRWFNGWSLFAILLVYCVVGFAQAPAGYTKMVSTTANTFTDTAVGAGQVFNYVVTATNAAGESGPSNVITAAIPATASTLCGTGISHCVTFTWTVPPTDAGHLAATGYNVYRELVTVPNPPVAASPTVN
jgi:hypothetical protein